MNRPIVAYASGPQSEIVQQHFAIEMHARSRRVSVAQRHADTDAGSIMQRAGLAAAIAAAAAQKAELCISSVSVSRIRDAGANVALRGT